MAKKNKGDGDPLGKLLVEGVQTKVDTANAVFAAAVLVGGLVLATAALLLRWHVAVPIIAGVLVLGGVGFLVKAMTRQPILFQLRKGGVVYVSGHREVELEWGEVRHATVQMVTDNPLLSFTGVNDAGAYVTRRADNLPFRLNIRGEAGESITITSHLLPPNTGRKVLEKLTAAVGVQNIDFELFGVLPQWSEDD
jgi:hypothetical protein